MNTDLEDLFTRITRMNANLASCGISENSWNSCKFFIRVHPCPSVVKFL